MTQERVTKIDEKPIKGLGITRGQLKDFLKGKISENDMRPLVVKEMYSREDDDYTLVTETHPRMVTTKIRLRLILAALDLAREKPLIQVFLEDYNREMVSYKRQGRQELLGALQALSVDEQGEERPVLLGR
jgi:hypothetical protein